MLFLELMAAAEGGILDTGAEPLGAADPALWGAASLAGLSAGVTGALVAAFGWRPEVRGLVALSVGAALGSLSAFALPDVSWPAGLVAGLVAGLGGNGALSLAYSVRHNGRHASPATPE